MSAVATIPEPGSLPPDPRAGKYVIFRLTHGEFGAAVCKVREVMEMLDITVVPNAPDFIAGVINLRGKVIPVVDLRGIFELHIDPPTTRSCIMVVQAMLASTEQVLGIVVDEVIEICSVESTDFIDTEEVPSISKLSSRGPAPYLVGVVRTGGKVRLLLDIDEVLNNIDLRREETIAAAA